ncbi:MAG TPA: amidohydrolase family protein [Chloroflexota bacterium]|nr:amidohydrolase family protein [Chloroflexota bacterium]
MAVIDADAHVHECEHTWDFMNGVDPSWRPQIVRKEGEDGSTREFWSFNGNLRPKGGNVGKVTPAPARELTDIGLRLRQMDQLGVDVQVLYPSLLTAVSDDPAVEGALWKSYNRWLAEAWTQGQGRLRWVARVPLDDVYAATAELRFAKDHGACGVFMRSVEGSRLLPDPYFFPIYEEASALDMPICVHASLGNSALVDLLSQDRDNGNFLKFKLSVIGAFHSLLVSGIPDAFPKLRFGFVEVSSDWVPYVVRELQKRFLWKGWNLPSESIMARNRMFVASQVDDDIPHVLRYAGEGNLVIGTDYGHADTSTELVAHRKLAQRGDVDPRVVERMLDDNPRALYGISEA